MTLRAVLFDVGGVLEINPPTGWLDSWATRLGLGSAELEARLERLWAGGEIGAVGLGEIERRIRDELGLTDGALAGLMGDVWAEYLGSPNRRMLELAERLRPRFKTGILSNSFVGAREREEEAYGFGERFDVIVYSHEVGRLRPDPAVYAIACERLGLAPRHVLFVDDDQANVEGARAVGMPAVRFVDTSQAIGEIVSRLGWRPS